MITEGPSDGPHIVVLDCGVKRNIIRSLLKSRRARDESCRTARRSPISPRLHRMA